MQHVNTSQWLCSPDLIIQMSKNTETGLQGKLVKALKAACILVYVVLCALAKQTQRT